MKKYSGAGIIVLFLLVVLAVISLGNLKPKHTGTIPRYKYVAVVVEENHSFEEVIGNPAMPYLNSLADKYGLAQNYFANKRGSISDYFWLTAGQELTTNNTTTEVFDVDNIFRRLIDAHLTWKSYQQSLPAAGFTDYATTGTYLKRHNPAAYFTDTVSAAQRQNIVPGSQLAVHIKSSALPNFMFITPDADHDAHDGTLRQADEWLKSNIQALIENEKFARDGLLIITFDEGQESDTRHGGGRVPTVLVSPKLLGSYSSDSFYQHQNLLKTICLAFGFTTCPGKADSAQAIDEFWQ